MRPQEPTHSTPDPSRWLELYGDYLFSHALLRVGRREAAEDLVQETFISAIQALGMFRGQSSEKTWLVAILKNKIIDYYRKRDVLKETSSYLSETDDEFTQGFFDKVDGHWLREAAPGHWNESADSEIQRSEFQAVVERCVGKLPTKLMAVFSAKFIEEEDSDKICKDYQLTSSNYWVIIHRAKVLFRACLERNWFLKNS